MTDVAGYRILRTAARGTRCRLLLGYDDGSTVVLKMADAGDPRFAVEVEALTRAAGDHVVELLDAHRDDQDAVLVLERLSHGTLAELLDHRAGLDAGEAVTILAPLAATVERIHTAGVAHGGLSLAAVCFAGDGSPTLVGFGEAELFAPGSPEIVREAVPGVLCDRAALCGLAELVLSRVAGTRADAARRLAAALGGMLPVDLEAALFDLAAAAPVRFEPDEDPGLTAPRVVLGEPISAELEPTPTLPPWLLAFVPESLRERIDEPLSRVKAAWDGWGIRRRRIVLGAVRGGSDRLPRAHRRAAVVHADRRASAHRARRVPRRSPTTCRTILSRRPSSCSPCAQRCFRDLSLLCLDNVGQPDSAALTDDRMLIRTVEDGGEFPPDGVLEGEFGARRTARRLRLDRPPRGQRCRRPSC